MSGEPWPARPEEIWAASAAEAPPVPRPPAPDVVSSLERFQERVEVEKGQAIVGWSFIVFGFIAFWLVVFAGGFGYRFAEPEFWTAFFTGREWYRDLMAWCVPASLLIGIYNVARSPKTHPRLVRRRFEETRRTGVLARAFDSGYSVPSGDSSIEVAFLIDSRIDDVRAARLQWAFAAWFERLDADEEAAQAFNERFAKFEALRSEAVFGPEAVGGFVRTDGRVGEHSRWRVLIPEKVREGESGEEWESLMVRGE